MGGFRWIPCASSKPVLQSRSWILLQMQTLATLRPRFAGPLNRSLLKTLSLRALSSSSSDYASQSLGGLPRFFSEVLPPSKGGIVHIQGDEFWHMSKVLRLSTNDRVELFNGKGGLIGGCIQRIDRCGLDFVALEDPKLVPTPGAYWHVFAAFGTLKGGRADWLVEKCTELGASSVTPLLTERSSSISENRVDRLQRVVLAATKQCQRLHEMILNPPMKIDGLLPLMGFPVVGGIVALVIPFYQLRVVPINIAQSKVCFVAVAEATPVVSALSLSGKECSGLIIVGPEGDFTKKEVEMMLEAGATAVGLGPLRLRVETATMALLSTLMLWSDSQQTSISTEPSCR
ncbi:ribosomal RNA small subunit methyltransferase E isoform X1 [Juglans microcarpa x Juglans regia]|uniref:ribosomal RNA small subunit methyltransferase E isoform X1 n=1 Tax=Juglans microcarpa x Juglans regia TaxID=2249226 RepID=UPI001B7F49B7|nr:ribosomal RNA small subunit methyltransferase E isoform X1 [Juglans microcarpa x Juglans regia]